MKWSSRANRWTSCVLLLIVVGILVFQLRGGSEAREETVSNASVDSILETSLTLEEALQSYIVKHTAVLSLPPEEQKNAKFLIYKSDPAYEISNRLFGLTSAFLFALLSNRFLLVEWAEPSTNHVEPQDSVPSMLYGLGAVLEPPFDWDSLAVPSFRSEDEFQPLVELTGKCKPKKKVLSKAYEILKCTNFTEFFQEFQVVRINAGEFFADWFRFNNYFKGAVGKLFGTNESIYGPLSRFLLRPQKHLHKFISDFQVKLASDYDYVIGLHIWSQGFLSTSFETKEEIKIFSCVKERMKRIGKENKKHRVGIFVCSDSFQAKVRAAQYFGASASFVDVSTLFVEGLDSHIGQMVKQEFAELWLLGETNEIVTTSKISNFTRAAAGRTGIPVFDGTQCVKQNTTAFWVRSPESCVLPGKCGKSIKHPWREDHPVWFTLRLIMFMLIPLGLMLCVFKWCSDRRAACW